jgi:transcription-repair coupling factor (superfamily II helicase)
MTVTTQPAENNSAGSNILDPAVPAARDRLVWTGLGGDSLPLAVANLADKHAGLVVVITPDMQSAELLQDQVEYFAAHNQLQVTTLPDWETLPYDKFSPHPDIISERCNMAC